MTVRFFGSPKKKTVKIKQIRFFKNRKKINKKLFFQNMTVLFLGSPKKTMVKIKRIRFFKI